MKFDDLPEIVWPPTVSDRWIGADRRLWHVVAIFSVPVDGEDTTMAVVRSWLPNKRRWVYEVVSPQSADILYRQA